MTERPRANSACLLLLYAPLDAAPYGPLYGWWPAPGPVADDLTGNWVLQYGFQSTTQIGALRPRLIINATPIGMTLHARAVEKNLHRLAGGADPAVVLPKATSDVAALRELTASALAEMRALIFELRPDAVTEHGLLEAVTRQSAALTVRTGVAVDVAGPAHRLPLPGDAEEHAYRITLEAINNALKHAAPQHVRVTITDLGGEVTITVSDDGCGFDPTENRIGHLGLRTMRERAERVGAALDLQTAPGVGTTISITLNADRKAARRDRIDDAHHTWCRAHHRLPRR